MAQRGNKIPACAKFGRNHSGMCRDGSTGSFNCGQNGPFIRECPKNRQDPGASLSFVTPYVAMNFNVLPEQLSEPSSVSTPVDLRTVDRMTVRAGRSSIGTEAGLLGHRSTDTNYGP
uniref:Retrotransposon gag protein n=1 Tax=Solanum tuberosum TaxID=4113 RepID=M1DG48_SOLTU